jgi:CheY-like chemotaxis protein
MASKRILIVDDSYDLTRVLKAAIQTLDKKIDVKVVPSAEEAMLEITRGNLDLIISDVRLPGISGMELLPKIRAKDPSVHIIMITGLTDRDLEEKARIAGANFFLRKPMDIPLFLDAVGSFLGIEVTVEKEKMIGLIPEAPFEVKEEEDIPIGNLSETLAALRQEVAAQMVVILDENGHLMAQVGENPFPDFERRLVPTILPVLTASEKFIQVMQEKPHSQATITFRFVNRDVIVAAVGDYALVVLLSKGRGQMRLLLALDTVIAYQEELYAILNQMGVLQTTGLSIEPQVADIAAEPETLEDTTEDDEEVLDDFAALFESRENLFIGPVDEFWEKAGDDSTVDLQNPDVISYEQAAKLGLAPEEE